MAISVKCNGFDVVCDTPAEAQKVIEHFGKSKTQNESTAPTIIRHAESATADNKGTLVAQMIDTLKAQGPMTTGNLIRKTFGQLDVALYRSRAALLYSLEKRGRLVKDSEKCWNLVQAKAGKAKLASKTKYVASGESARSQIEKLLSEKGPMETAEILEHLCGTIYTKKTKRERAAISYMRTRGDIRKNSKDQWVLV